MPIAPFIDPLVLIVDDDRDLRDALADLVAQAAYRTATAANGAEALRYLQARRREACIVLLDLHLPDMDGRELIDTLAREQIDARLIVLTGATQPELPAGVRWLQKPVERHALLAAIAAASPKDMPSEHLKVGSADQVSRTDAAGRRAVGCLSVLLMVAAVPGILLGVLIYLNSQSSAESHSGTVGALSGLGELVGIGIVVAATTVFILGAVFFARSARDWSSWRRSPTDPSKSERSSASRSPARITRRGACITSVGATMTRSSSGPSGSKLTLRTVRAMSLSS